MNLVSVIFLEFDSCNMTILFIVSAAAAERLTGHRRFVRKRGELLNGNQCVCVYEWL